jgi:hypothetical protein
VPKTKKKFYILFLCRIRNEHFLIRIRDKHPGSATQSTGVLKINSYGSRKSCLDHSYGFKPKQVTSSLIAQIGSIVKYFYTMVILEVLEIIHASGSGLRRLR